MRKHVLDTLSRDEIQRMEDAADTERDKLIVRLLADTGMRLGELLALRPQDIRVEGGKNVLKVRGKEDRDRLVPLSPALARRLKRFADRGRRDSSTDHIFLTLRRGRASGQLDPVTESAVEQVIRALGQVAGIRSAFIRICFDTRLQPTTCSAEAIPSCSSRSLAIVRWR
jgi:integrase